MDATSLRNAMVDRLVDAGVVRDARVADALRRVPRHAFLAPDAQDAYVDSPLAIGEGQTISAPHMVATMLEALDLRPGHRVLEVGGGSGYHAALAAELVKPSGHVWTVERFESLAEGARSALRAHGYDALVDVVVGDGSVGLPDLAPFDRVSVACAAPAVPPPLLASLASPGRLVVPVGSRDEQELLLVDKDADGLVVERPLGLVRFVPLIGAHGF